MSTESVSAKIDKHVDDSNSDSDAADASGNAGWADTFAKVLQQKKPKNKKYLVLSRAAKLDDQKIKKEVTQQAGFEIEQKLAKDDDEDDDEEEDDDDMADDEEQTEEKPTTEELALALTVQKERNNKLLALRVKPSIMDRERERSFRRISTRGVVQLFNAVRSQQRDLVDKVEKAGKLDHRRDEVLNNIDKKQFLHVLMGGDRAKSENVDNPIKDEDGGAGKQQWSVLR